MTTFDAAFRRIAEGAPIVMVLGGAGTGKTTFLHELRRRAGVRQVFLAPTGVAALQLGGQTIHSFFGIPPRILNPDEVKPRARSRKLLGKIDRLVIDEVSMVRCDLLDVVDRCLRVARNRPEPFGGVQVVLVGDFLQFPPVVPLADRACWREWTMRAPMPLTPKCSKEHRWRAWLSRPSIARPTVLSLSI